VITKIFLDFYAVVFTASQFVISRNLSRCWSVKFLKIKISQVVKRHAFGVVGYLAITLLQIYC